MQPANVPVLVAGVTERCRIIWSRIACVVKKQIKESVDRMLCAPLEKLPRTIELPIGSHLSSPFVWHWLEDKLQNASGVCYYKYPIVGFGGTEIPDFTLLVRGYQPFAIRCIDFDLVDIQDVTTETWQVRDGGKSKTIYSPFAVADDFKVWLNQRFERERPLRGKVSPAGVVALPLITRQSFLEKFDAPQDSHIFWRDGECLQKFLKDNESSLTDEEWRIARSVLQAATPINVASGPAPSKTDTIRQSN